MMQIVVHAVSASNQGDGKENAWGPASALVRESNPEVVSLDLRLNGTKKPDDLGEEHSSQREQKGCRDLSTHRPGKKFDFYFSCSGGHRELSHGE